MKLNIIKTNVRKTYVDHDQRKPKDYLSCPHSTPQGRPQSYTAQRKLEEQLLVFDRWKCVNGFWSTASSGIIPSALFNSQRDRQFACNTAKTQLSLGKRMSCVQRCQEATTFCFVVCFIPDWRSRATANKCTNVVIKMCCKCFNYITAKQGLYKCQKWSVVEFSTETKTREVKELTRSDEMWLWGLI